MKDFEKTTTKYNKLITYEGITKSVSQWARIYGIPPMTLNVRLDRGWTFKDAIEKPIRKYMSYSHTRCVKKLEDIKDLPASKIKYQKDDFIHFIKYKGEIKSLSQWAVQYGMSRQALANRMRRGMSFRDAIGKPIRKRKRKVEMCNG